MEYATQIAPWTPSNNLKPENIDSGYSKFVGWNETVASSPTYQFLFAPDRMLTYQAKITELLQGVDKHGRSIIVPMETIGSVLSQCFQSNVPQTGDIYSRYIIPEQETQRNDVNEIVNRMINIIVSQISNEMLTAQNNQKLTVWNTLLGDFNKQGLRAHGPIKIRKRRPQAMFFFENY